MPTGKHGRIDARQAPIDRQHRPALPGNAGKILRLEWVRIQADEVQPATRPQGQRRHHGEVQPRAESQFADAQRPSPCGCPAGHATKIDRVDKNPLRLASGVGRMIDVAELPRERHPVAPARNRGFDHGATGRAGSAIHSLQEPG